jgi:hypothetical protein
MGRACSTNGSEEEKPEGKRPLGRPRRKWMDDVKMNLRETGWRGMNWRALVNTVMNLRVPHNVGKFLSSCTTGVFSVELGPLSSSWELTKKPRIRNSYCFIAYFTSEILYFGYLFSYMTVYNCDYFHSPAMLNTDYFSTVFTCNEYRTETLHCNEETIE